MNGIDAFDNGTKSGRIIRRRLKMCRRSPCC